MAPMERGNRLLQLFGDRARRQLGPLATVQLGARDLLQEHGMPVSMPDSTVRLRSPAWHTGAPGGVTPSHARKRGLVEVRTGQGDVKLTRAEFERRLRERFYDPAFHSVGRQIADVVEVAWTAYDEYRKSPRMRKAGPAFADAEFELPIEWLETRAHSAGRTGCLQRAHN